MEMRTFRRKNTENRRAWHGAAVIIEALALLFFLIVCIAILMQLMSFSYNRGQEANALSNAVILASNDAERFGANPTRSTHAEVYDFVDGALTEVNEWTEQSYVVSRTISVDTQESGSLYHATITVVYQGEPIYSLETARYVSNGGVALNG